MKVRKKNQNLSINTETRDAQYGSSIVTIFSKKKLGLCLFVSR